MQASLKECKDKAIRCDREMSQLRDEKQAIEKELEAEKKKVLAQKSVVNELEASDEARAKQIEELKAGLSALEAQSRTDGSDLLSLRKQLAELGILRRQLDESIEESNEKGKRISVLEGAARKTKDEMAELTQQGDVDNCHH